MNFTQPDITLHLTREGVIEDVNLADSISDERLEAWIGKPWNETVDNVARSEIRHMIEDARANGVAAHRQITQIFPSGNELPIEYTTVRLDKAGGLLAVGKSVRAVTELQSRLISTQNMMERDYWKLRDIETRYRLLFEATTEPVVVINAKDQRIVEANPSAMRALGNSTESGLFVDSIAEADREKFNNLLDQVRTEGQAPAISLRLASMNERWLLRASVMMSDSEPVYLLQITPINAGLIAERSNGDPSHMPATFDNLPDGFAVLDAKGTVEQANGAFLDLVQASSERTVVGQNLSKWLGRPNADMTVLLSNLRKSKIVRLFVTTIEGELGTETDVEISASIYSDGETEKISLLLRDVSRRLANNTSATPKDQKTARGQVGKAALKSIVVDMVGTVERECIEAALKMTHGHRTAAAELLGVSRQSLYSKLERYGLSEKNQDKGR